MIPSDREIKLALKRDFIRITPLPPDKAISSTSVDLTLHEEISFWDARRKRPAGPVVVYPGRPEFDIVVLMREHLTASILSPEVILLVLVQPQANIGQLLLEIRRNREHIAALV